MHRKLIQMGAIGMFISISLGALGAHQLKKMLSPGSLDIFHTAVDYLLYHSLAFLIIAALAQMLSPRYFQRAVWFFAAGMLLFSGSLFSICFLQTYETPIPIWLGILTPIGGLCFIIGWLMIAIAASKKT